MLVLELVGWQSEFKNLTTNTTELMMAHTHTHTHTYTHTQRSCDWNRKSCNNRHTHTSLNIQVRYYRHVTNIMRMESAVCLLVLELHFCGGLDD